MSENIRQLCTNPDYLKLFRSMKKVYKLQCQTDFMNKCRAENVIPQGINNQCQFKLSYDNPSISVQVSKLFQATKSRTLDIIIKDYENNTKAWRKSMYVQLSVLRNTYESSIVDNVLTDFNVYFVPITNKLRLNHQQKLSNLLRQKENYLYVKSDDYQYQEQPSVSKPKKKQNRKFKNKKTKPRSNRKQTLNKLIKGNEAVKVNDLMILNLSGKTLTDEQKEVLTLGPDFAPTPSHPQIDKRDNDIDRWASKLRWAHFFSRVTPSNTPNHHRETEIALIPPSGKEAPKSTSQALELYIQLTVKELKSNGLCNNSFDNMSPNHRQALKQLQSWDDSVFRYFDKGTGWVIDTQENYEQKVMEHLGDADTFTPINEANDTSPIPRKIKEINEVIEKWVETSLESGDISQRLASWIVKEESRPGYDYCNYKVHKPQANYPGRLITSGCGSPTENLAAWSDYYLKQIVVELPYVLKDSSEFLYQIQKFNLTQHDKIDDIILVSWDVVAMFPSIDNVMGLDACHDLLEKRDVLFPSTTSILEATKITLENNISYFNNVAFVQNNGTAMGPHNACSYADIAMHPIDQIINNNENYTIALWCRFKDDIFCPWIMGLEKLHEFHAWINSLHPKIKFTMNFSEDPLEGIEYLDTRVYIKNSFIDTTLYTKPSDTHAYLNPNSCHPKHVSSNIPQGVAKRIKRICSEESEYFKHKLSHTNHFVSRGYNRDFITTEFDKCDNLNRLDLIGDPEISFNIESKESGRRIPLVLDFHPSYAGATKAVNKHKHLLDLDDTLKEVVSKDKIFVTFRKAKTIGDSLVHSRYSRDSSENNSSSIR